MTSRPYGKKITDEPTNQPTDRRTDRVIGKIHYNDYTTNRFVSKVVRLPAQRACRASYRHLCHCRIHRHLAKGEIRVRSISVTNLYLDPVYVCPATFVKWFRMWSQVHLVLH